MQELIDPKEVFVITEDYLSIYENRMFWTENEAIQEKETHVPTWDVVSLDFYIKEKYMSTDPECEIQSIKIIKCDEEADIKQIREKSE